MAITKSRIQKNLERIRANIASACQRSGRYPEQITLVAVTKATDLESIKALLELGQADLGESRAQQLVPRANETAAHMARKRTASPTQPKWHMIGHLQRNKVKAVLQCASLIHSVDSLRLAEEINSRAQRDDKIADVLLQVNCSEESQKHGVAVGAAAYLGELMASMSNLRLSGLMTIAELSEDSGKARAAFIRLRELFEEMKHNKIGGENFKHLSMGMSHDYEMAVEEGATILRIGTALFE